MDKELRENVTGILEIFGTRVKDICDEQPYLMMLIAKSCEARNEALESILALIPDKETDAISYTKGVLDGVKRERERIKEEVDKLTVIEERGIEAVLEAYWELYCPLWNDGLITEDDYDSGIEYWRVEAQLQHTKNELGLMGE